MASVQPRFAQWPNGDLTGFHVVEHEDGTVTVSRSGSTLDSDFVEWFAHYTTDGAHAIQALIRAWSEGRRGRDGQYRPVTRTSLTFDPDTFNDADLARTALGPFDGNPVVNN